MTLRSLISADVTAVCLDTDDFAESVIRLVGGRSGFAEVVTAIVFWLDTSEDDRYGRGQVRKCELLLPDTQTVSNNDAFKIGVHTVQVETMSEASNGMRRVMARQYIPETKGARPVRTGDI